jgi:hypothetical protein
MNTLIRWLEQLPKVIRAAHEHSSNHRKEIESSELCGCFNCCSTFLPNEITQWIDENDEGIGQCALCPRCGIDSVIGSHSGFAINEEFLKEMKNHWFDEHTP